MPPPAEHRGDEVLREGERERLERAEDVDAGRVEARLLLRFAKRSTDRLLPGVEAPARKSDLARVRTQRLRAGKEQHVEIARNGVGGMRTRLAVEDAEQDEHGGGAGIRRLRGAAQRRESAPRCAVGDGSGQRLHLRAGAERGGIEGHPFRLRRFAGRGSALPAGPAPVKGVGSAAGLHEADRVAHSAPREEHPMSTAFPDSPGETPGPVNPPDPGLPGAPEEPLAPYPSEPLAPNPTEPFAPHPEEPLTSPDGPIR